MTAAGTNVLTITLNPSLDISAEVDRVVPEDKLRTAFLGAEPGGGGINVSRVLHRFGAETQAVVPMGGVVSQELANQLQNEGVAVRAVPVAGDTRRSITVFETATGAHFRFVTTGAPMSEPEWRSVLTEVAAVEPAPRFVVLSGSLPPGVPGAFVTELVELARRRDVAVVVDTKGEGLAAAVDAGVAMVKPNKRELAELVGHNGARDDLDVDAALLELVARGVTVAAVSLGPDGAAVAHEGRVRRFSAPAVEVVSTVGAGDSMVAGMLLGVLEGRSGVDAVRFGIACGAAACLTPGSELVRPADAHRLEAEVVELT